MLQTVRKIMKSSQRLDEAKEEVLALEARKEDLIQEIDYKNTPGYIEETARNELNMARPGEEIYIYPKEDQGTRKNTQRYVPTEEKKPIEQWASLFF